MIPDTTSRVSRHTSPRVNEQIQRQTERRIDTYAHASHQAIDRRIEHLNQEWDIERMLEMNASTLSLIGIFLGATVNRRWYIVPAVVNGFLLQHAIQGWCPPVPLFRRLGFRTATEIDQERYALKLLRGDFKDLPIDPENRERQPDRIIDAMQR